ncbi:MAG: metallopeptidase TldD-related protein [Ruminiclostridium sp.]|nr:metallopeptidase TldD-related protein [Ruminiclostridium sp.]
MIKELYQQSIRELSVSVSQSKVDAVMKKNITKSGCRVYKDGFIGVTGTFGEPTEETWRGAIENLSSQIYYPFEPEKNSKRIRDLREINMSDQDFIDHAEYILEVLRNEFPDFIFSNKMKMIETKNSIKNDTGLDYVNYDKTLEYGLILKHKDSVNVFDSFIGRSTRNFDEDGFLAEARSMLRAYSNEVSLPQQKIMPVIFSYDELLTKIIQSLNGEEIGLGTSLFANKMQTKAFSEHFSAYQDMTSEKLHTPFFDMEGVTNPQDLCYFIKNGVIEKAYTDKNNAFRFSIPMTGSASGAYDDIPSLKSTTLSVLPSEQTLKELLNGKLAALVIMASGGDYSGTGDYASPIQMAYLTDGDRILGKLPEFNISGNLYNIFGKDYIGCSNDKPFFGERGRVFNMTIN